MSTCRLVGWFNDSEWEVVYWNLFYGSEEQIQSALDRISVWRCRFASRIPVAVEATSHLLTSVIKKGDENDAEKRLAMAAALSQFVGLLTERSLKGQVYTKPIHIRGAKMGIPEWLVTLRHESAHCLLPSYYMLDKGVKYALDWLKECYWDEQFRKQRMAPKRETGTLVTEGEVVRLLKKCFVLMKRKSSVDKESVAMLSKLISCETAGVLLGQILLDYNFILLDNGFEDHFIFTKLNKNEKKRSLNTNVETLFNMLFLILAKCETLENFFLKLINTYSYRTTKKDLWATWVNFTLDFLSSYPGVAESVGQEKVLRCLLENRAPIEVIEKATLIEKIRNSSDVIQLTKLLSSPAQIGHIKYASEDSSKLNALLSDTDEESHVEEMDVQISKKANIKSWSKCPVDLSLSPLGLLPDQDPKTFWQALAKSSLNCDCEFPEIGEKRLTKSRFKPDPSESTESMLIANEIDFF